MRSGHARVYFFDIHTRVGMIYTFGPSGERLFLRNITTYDYGDLDEYLGMSQAQRLEQDDFIWEPMSAFGEYTSLARASRSEQLTEREPAAKR